LRKFEKTIWVRPAATWYVPPAFKMFKKADPALLQTTKSSNMAWSLSFNSVSSVPFVPDGASGSFMFSSSMYRNVIPAESLTHTCTYFRNLKISDWQLPPTRGFEQDSPDGPSRYVSLYVTSPERLLNSILVQLVQSESDPSLDIKQKSSSRALSANDSNWGGPLKITAKEILASYDENVSSLFFLVLLPLSTSAHVDSRCRNSLACDSASLPIIPFQHLHSLRELLSVSSIRSRTPIPSSSFTVPIKKLCTFSRAKPFLFRLHLTSKHVNLFFFSTLLYAVPPADVFESLKSSKLDSPKLAHRRSKISGLSLSLLTKTVYLWKLPRKSSYRLYLRLPITT